MNTFFLTKNLLFKNFNQTTQANISTNKFEYVFVNLIRLTSLKFPSLKNYYNKKKSLVFKKNAKVVCSTQILLDFYTQPFLTKEMQNLNKFVSTHLRHVHAYTTSNFNKRFSLKYVDSYSKFLYCDYNIFNVLKLQFRLKKFKPTCFRRSYFQTSTLIKQKQHSLSATFNKDGVITQILKKNVGIWGVKKQPEQYSINNFFTSVKVLNSSLTQSIRFNGYLLARRNYLQKMVQNTFTTTKFLRFYNRYVSPIDFFLPSYVYLHGVLSNKKKND